MRISESISLSIIYISVSVYLSTYLPAYLSTPYLSLTHPSIQHLEHLTRAPSLQPGHQSVSEGLSTQGPLTFQATLLQNPGDTPVSPTAHSLWDPSIPFPLPAPRSCSVPNTQNPPSCILSPREVPFVLTTQEREALDLQPAGTHALWAEETAQCRSR